MGNDEFLKIATEEVRRYTNEHLEDPQDFDVYVVWVCKTLQNNKALLSTTLLDGMYFECTYNGDKQEMYLDAYRKLDDMTVKYEARTLTFIPRCSLDLLKEQKKHLGNYIRTLKIRAEIEGIEL